MIYDPSYEVVYKLIEWNIYIHEMVVLTSYSKAGWTEKDRIQWLGYSVPSILCNCIYAKLVAMISNH